MSLMMVLFALSLVVVIHEAGHMLVGKIAKVKVRQFSIGFGPTLLSVRKTHIDGRWVWGYKSFLFGGRTQFDVSASVAPSELPLMLMSQHQLEDPKQREWLDDITGIEWKLGLMPMGGYVLFKGTGPNETLRGTLQSLPLYKRLLVSLAGPLANLVTAVLFLWVAFLTPGTTSSHYWGQPVSEIDILTVSACVETSVDALETTLHLPVRMYEQLRASFNDFVKKLFGSPGESYLGYGELASQLETAIEQGVGDFFFSLFLFSAILAIFNLLPIPPLDGSHVVRDLLNALLPIKAAAVMNKLWISLASMVLFLEIVLFLYLFSNDLIVYLYNVMVP